MTQNEEVLPNIQTSKASVQGVINAREVAYCKNEEKDKKNFILNCCSLEFGIIKTIKYLIITTIISILFTVASLITAFKFNKKYTDLRNLFISEYKNEIYSFHKFWCNIVNWDEAFLIISLIIFILYLVILFVHKYVYNKYIKIESEAGTLYKLFIFIDYLFYLLFKVLIIFNVYIFDYSLIVTIICPSTDKSQLISISSSYGANEEKEWLKNRLMAGFHVGLLFFLLLSMLCSLLPKRLYLLLLSMKFDDDIRIENIEDIKNENDLNNNNIQNDKVKNTKIKIGGRDLNIGVKMNNNLYLQNTNNEIITFKPIIIKKEADFDIYIKTNNKSIEDQLSLTDWEKGKADNLYELLQLIANSIFTTICMTIIAMIIKTKNVSGYKLLHDEAKYNKDIKYGNIYVIYGDFESGVTLSRFIIYLVLLVLLVLSMIKRMIYGGYKDYILIMLSFIFSIILNLINIVFILLSFLLVIFSILCIVTDNYGRKNDYYGEDRLDYFLLRVIFIIHLILNILIIINIGLIFKKCIELLTSIYKIRKDYAELNDNNTQKDKKGISNKNINDGGELKFIYDGLDLHHYTLNEYVINDLPRYLFYVLDAKKSKNEINIHLNLKNSFQSRNEEMIDGKSEKLNLNKTQRSERNNLNDENNK